MQIIQLMLIALHSVHYVFLDCEAILIGKAFVLLTIFVTSAFIYLFLMFFKQRYACVHEASLKHKPN